MTTINEHIKNICEEDGQDTEATIRKFRIVQTEGEREVSRLIDFYKLDLILAVGYRVRSLRDIYGSFPPRQIPLNASNM